MEGLDIGLDLLTVLVTAIAGGLVARLLRLPIILGYLLGGVIIGPFGLRLVQDTRTINSLAEIGVILLLFAIGLDFSLKELLRFGRVAVLGGITQIVLTAAVGLVLGWAIGMAMLGAVFFGFIIALSSTMVVMKLLMDRGEVDTVHGRVLLGILLVQDLSVVPMMVAMPALAGQADGLLMQLAIAMAKAVGFIGLMLALGYWGMPWFLKRVAGQRTRELFLLTVVVVCLAAAFGTYAFGLSAAFGAFAAGLLISQSGYARQAFADILPLRDTFAALFFVSLGMLADLPFVVDHARTVAVVVAAIMLVKFVIGSLVVRIFRYGHKTALMVGTGLINIGEFSFILAMMGRDLGLLSESLYSLTIAAAIVTMLLTPFVMSLNSFLYLRISQQPWFARRLASLDEHAWPSASPELARHAVICGYGSVGGRVARVLERQKFPYLVIDLDPVTLSALRAHGVPCIYGDASNPEILAHANLEKARVMVCTVPDYVATELTVRNALKINPRLDIVARVHRDSDIELFRGAGVAELVLPFFEGSLEMIRHTLHRFGMSSTEIQYILNQLRNTETRPPEKGSDLKDYEKL